MRKERKGRRRKAEGCEEEEEKGGETFWLRQCLSNGASSRTTSTTNYFGTKIVYNSALVKRLRAVFIYTPIFGPGLCNGVM